MTVQDTRVPQHVAIIMDGNRRWARQKLMPSAAGHAAGARRVRAVVEACAHRGVRYLTLFAFSTENWKRPPDEVSSLMELFVRYLRSEVDRMNAAAVRLKVIGDTSAFNPLLQRLIAEAQARTQHNQGITLTVAANYGGRWDMLQAARAWQSAHPGRLLDEANEEDLHRYLSTAYAPDPDLLIRTGGEYRISNLCCGSQPTPSCTSPTRCGRTFLLKNWTSRSRGTQGGIAGSGHRAPSIRGWPPAESSTHARVEWARSLALGRPPRIKTRKLCSRAEDS